MANDELDKYGVWVKKAPKTVDSEIESTTDIELDDFPIEETTTDMPDFSDIEIESEPSVVEESAPDAPAEEAVSEEEISFGGDDEEISLDDFLDGGFSESKDAFEAGLAEVEEKVAAVQSGAVEPETSSDDFVIDSDGSDSGDSGDAASDSGEEESVDLSDFGFEDTGDAPSDDFSTPQETEVATSEDDSPLDIDLSFDDAPSSDEPFDMGSSEESVSLSDEPNPNLQEGEEEISLDDFGVDFSDDAGQGGAPEATETAADDSGNIEMSVMADDDAEEEVSIESDSSSDAMQSAPETSAGGDDDFDVDALFDNIEDENGNTVSFDEPAEEPIVEEPIAEEPSVEEPPVEDIAIEEPMVEETAIEEPVSDDFTIESSSLEDNFDMPPMEAMEEPDVVENEPVDEIPDSFDEETNSILSEFADSQEEEAAPEAEMPAEESIEMPTPEPVSEPTPAPAPSNDAANDILSQIMGELQSLKSEINGLKDDLANLKERENATPTPINAFAPTNAYEPVAQEAPDPFAEIGDEIPTEEESSGFFDDDDGDDTIALSGDELTNILNCAEFDSIESEGETEDEPVSEPEIDLDLGGEETESETTEPLPDEIMVPKDEDIIVEEEPFTYGEEAPATTEDFAATEDSSPTEDFAATTEPDATVDSAVTDESPDLSDASLDYLNSDANSIAHTTGAEISSGEDLSSNLKSEIVNVLTYMDSLLENLPDEKIEEFAKSEQFEAYKKVFKDLGLA